MTMHPEYETLLDEYLSELKLARDDALKRVEGRLRTWTQRLGSEARAREQLSQQPPLCTGTRVIAVVRKYWLACDALNRKYPAHSIDPREFLVSWARSKDPKLADFVSELPYWPIGKDEEGNWV